MPVRTLGRTRLISDFTIGPVPGSGGTIDYPYIPVSEFGSVLFFVEVKNSATNEVEAFTSNVADTSTRDPDDTIYGKVGEDLNFTFNVLKIGSEIVIRVVNNEADPILLRFVRITF